MVRVDGIEPTTSAWKADVLPLNYTRGNEVEEDVETLTLGSSQELIECAKDSN